MPRDRFVIVRFDGFELERPSEFGSFCIVAANAVRAGYFGRYAVSYRGKACGSLEVADRGWTIAGTDGRIIATKSVERATRARPCAAHM